MSRILSAYEADRDFPIRKEDPALRYFIAATPRTGSTYLALQLWETGILGAPMEYLNLKHSARMRDRLGNGDDALFWTELKRVRTSPNGVFGIKMFPGNYVRIAKKYPSLLKHIWFDKAIFITRRDKVQQAISHYRAYHGGSWYSGTPEKRPVEYDFLGIAKFYNSAKKNEEKWTRIFEIMNIAPHVVVYEDFIVAPHQTVDAIIRYFGMNTPRTPIADVMTTDIQRDKVSDDWRHRFLDEARKLGEVALKTQGGFAST